MWPAGLSTEVDAMTDEKRKPGRPRKWSSDAERMRAARAAKRAERAAEAERREEEIREREASRRERCAASPEVTSGQSKNRVTSSDVHATCQAEITRLYQELRETEDAYDDAVYDTWVWEHQYRMALVRMRDRDPEGVEWLDQEVRRWESRRAGHLEDRRRMRQRIGRRLG